MTKVRATYVTFVYELDVFRVKDPSILKVRTDLVVEGVLVYVVPRTVKLESGWVPKITLAVSYAPSLLDEKAMSKLRNYLKQLRENGAELVEVSVVVSKLLHEGE